MKKIVLILMFSLVVSLSAQVTDEQLRQPPGKDWLTYNGSYDSQRNSTLDQIKLANVSSLVSQWAFHVSGGASMQSVPIAVHGVLYFTQPNALYAIDGRSGRLIWDHHHQLTTVKDREGPQRGAAVYKDRVYYLTTDDYLIALDASTGSVVYQIKIAETKEGYSAPPAPFIANGKIIVGVAPGDRGLNGWIEAYDAETGKRLWHWAAIPGPGEPGNETWAGDSWKHAGAAAWMSGSYDPELNLYYLGMGNPSPDFNGDVRKGDNLYSECMVALDLDNGKLKWYFQFTPHDMMDWDGAEMPVLVDAKYEGKMRKLMVHADRNGFYYVLDRETGKFLHGVPFVQKMNWASGLAASGRPIRIPGVEPSLKGTKVCPSSIGATNWMSPAYSPQTNLFYVVALEGCGLATKNTETFRPGGFQYRAGGDVLLHDADWKVYVRALDLLTGRQVWEQERIGNSALGGGVLSTNGGILFSGELDGEFVALNARTGKPVWHYNTGEGINAQPMTYMVDGKQYVAIATNTTVFSFALFEPQKVTAK
ncbi:PQQ-dependent dehydrogenase, methanol/ethanol family [Granulicella sp. WH15]|uniref:PQQ-dependent dehydrogenase, methanol/ethanol family n=1 Tax=Granulicella sp. WH15 TaxID=2602070 RepID=UPI001366BE3F|nr:PQQ-dependent dehydrogenase, methanol/ethanol family [Granulicella sp. WH15]QHN03247.1 PQQ-dependent dehydrogenase, methanol/ethanol family [Granulicella sp. WH15]